MLADHSRFASPLEIYRTQAAISGPSLFPPPLQPPRPPNPPTPSSNPTKTVTTARACGALLLVVSPLLKLGRSRRSSSRVERMAACGVGWCPLRPSRVTGRARRRLMDQGVSFAYGTLRRDEWLTLILSSRALTRAVLAFLEPLGIIKAFTVKVDPRSGKQEDLLLNAEGYASIFLVSVGEADSHPLSQSALPRLDHAVLTTISSSTSLLITLPPQPLSPPPSLPFLHLRRPRLDRRSLGLHEPRAGNPR